MGSNGLERIRINWHRLRFFERGLNFEWVQTGWKELEYAGMG